MIRSRIKKEVLELLDADFSQDLMDRLDRYDPEKVIGPLFSGLCSPSERIRWNAIRGFGCVVSELACSDVEKARVVMRRFLWSLNDESGGIGWGAPEAMAEVMCNSAVLRSEYLHMLISYMREDGDEPFQDGNYLELPMLQRGLLWGIGRLCEKYPQEMNGLGISADLLPYLKSEDTGVVGLALLALSFLPVGVTAETVEPWLGSSLLLQLYVGDGMREISLSDLARLAAKKKVRE